MSNAEPSSSNASSTPSIRTFQMDGSSAGVLKNSVNLFRGDVNYTQKLFSMPGRSSNDGLQVDLSIQYQSNINQQAMTWNRDQPTGILGLGWSLPASVIILDDKGATTPGLRSYTLSAAGVSSQLVREAAGALLFSMAAVPLRNGEAVHPAVRHQFVQLGLPLSSDAIVVGVASPWVLQDEALEQEYILVLVNGQLAAYDGGESYQLANYKFWKVLYYPKYERWQVTNESGQRMSYGGGVNITAQKNNSSAGNSIEWGVQWTDSKGLPLWQGNSAVTTGQKQYARAWHLVRAYSRFGEFISYGYNEFARDGSGLLPDVEQAVGIGGKPYTKACYLTSITDVFGRKATFNYAAKLWSNIAAESAREYADPHKTIPDTTPNGFQDCYETYFLDNIVVQHIDGITLFSVQFDYQPSSDTAVANFVDKGCSGDTCKRLLTKVTWLNSQQESLPGFKFDYYLNGQNTNLGALRSITWPTGGVATYAYQSVTLDICQRSLSLTPPTPQLAKAAMPRVWFGSDYAVVFWYGTSAEQLSLQILTWNGQWNSWQPDLSSPLLVDGAGGISLNTLNVQTSENFVAVTYNTSTNTNLHLFRKDPARPAQWVAAAIPGGGSGGCNSPTWTWPLNQGKVSMNAGENFLLAGQMNTSLNKGGYDVFTWNWPTQKWTHTNTKTASYTWFTNGSEYFATIDMQSSTVQLNYLTLTGTWQQNEGYQLGFSLRDFTSVQMVSDASMLVISRLVSGAPTSGQYSYDIYPLQWNSNYEFVPSQKYSFQDRCDKNYPTSWKPLIVSNTLIAIAANLLRFNGQTWLSNSNLKPTSFMTGWQQRLAYGPDYATMIYINGNGSGGTPTAQLLSYDANNTGTSWSDMPTSFSPGTINIPLRNQSTANWGSGNNPDYLTLGNQLFSRGVQTDWAKSISTSIADLQRLINGDGSSRYQLNTESMITQGSNFIACAAYDTQVSGGYATVSSVIVLRNGTIYGAPELLNGQRMWTSQEGDGLGKYPSGSSAFVTYPDTANNFASASTITLHRYAGNAIQGPISDWPVCSITIDDGLSEVFTTSYVQDTATAGCDATGQVIKYFKSTVYPGGTALNPVNGSVVSCYLNSNKEVMGANNYYNILDGLLHSVSSYDMKGNLLASKTNTWTAYVNCAGHPTDASVSPTQLYGAYVLQTKEDIMKDGVSSFKLTTYIPTGLAFPYTGQPASASTVTWNGADQAEENVQTYTYACEVNLSSLVLNDVTSLVERVSSNAGVITSATATTLASWPTQWGSDILTPVEEADFIWVGDPNARVVNHDMFETTRAAIGHASDGLGTKKRGMPQTRADTWRRGTQSHPDVRSVTYACQTDVASSVLEDGGDIDGVSLPYTVAKYSGDVLVPEERSDFNVRGSTSSIFPFANYADGETPSGWQNTTRICQRQDNGTVLKQIDGADTQLCYLFSTTLGLPIATFKGADLTECAWNNFQSNEDQSNWLQSNTTICTTNAWLGVQSLCLSNHSGSLRTFVVPAKGRTHYLLGFRYQTHTGYRSDKYSGWTITADNKTVGTAPFADTQGQWRYSTTSVFFESGLSELTILAENKGSADVLLDSVLLVPWGTDVDVQSWYNDTRLLKASMNAAGNASFVLYDNFNRVFGAVGADGQLQELNMRFQSRQGSASDCFDNASPNAELTLQMDAGGIAENFIDDGQWSRRWQPGNSVLWNVNHGVLNKFSQNPDTLTWKGNTSNINRAAFFIEITALAILRGPVAIQFGQGQSITWTPNQGWSLTDVTHNSVQKALATPPQMATQWLLVLTPGQLFFFGNGQLLFSHETTATVAQGCIFSTGVNALQVNNLGSGLDPRFGLSYTDGAARQRQVHQLYGSDSRVMEMVYDALDRKLATTRVALGNFGSGAKTPTMQYRDTFLNVSAFLGAWQTSCAMTGDVADYYAGQFEGGVQRSNDQNYPYTGLRYESSVQKRVVESGKPGLQQAIHNVNTTTPAQRHTTRTVYGTNNERDALQAGKYYVQETTTPGGYQKRQLSDTSNRCVSMMQLDRQDNCVSQTQASPSYSTVGVTSSLRLPNAFTDGPQTNSAAFVRTLLTNPIGQVNSYTDSDTGTTQYLFDGKGQSRFVKVPLESGEEYFLYTKYDTLGRLIEEGVVTQAWNASTLDTQVNKLDYPSLADGAKVARTYTYDGDGSDPNNLGKLTKVITFNISPVSESNLGECRVTESWDYDVLGRVKTASMAISGATNFNTSATYHYNNLNEIIQIDLPDSSPLPSITYTYDDQGHITDIGTPDDRSAIARYTYNADGEILSMIRGALVDTWGYDSPGSILLHQVRVGEKIVFKQ